MIIIQPSGGLCNRIRSINSAATLARKKGVPLKVLWLNAPELNCPFEELFLPTDEFELINIHSLNNPKKLFLQLTARQRFNNEDILKNKTGDMLNEDFYEKLSDSVYIFTWEQFYPTEDYHLFRPTPQIQEKINAITADFSSHMIGVHIRRTDNVTAIGKSGTDAFIRAMKAEIAALRSGASTEYTDGVSLKKKTIAAYLREHPGVTSKSLIARELKMHRSTVQRYYDEIREEFRERG